MEMPFERRRVLEALAREVTTADLNRILSTFPHILYEAVREINGEVKYTMVEVTDAGDELID